MCINKSSNKDTNKSSSDNIMWLTNAPHPRHQNGISSECILRLNK